MSLANNLSPNVKGTIRQDFRPLVFLLIFRIYLGHFPTDLNIIDFLGKISPSYSNLIVLNSGEIDSPRYQTLGD